MGWKKKSIESEEYKLSYDIDRIRKLIRMHRGMPGTISKETKIQKRNLGLLYRLAKLYLFYPAE